MTTTVAGSTMRTESQERHIPYVLVLIFTALAAGIVAAGWFYFQAYEAQSNAALKLRIPLRSENNPAVAAVRGHEGAMEGVDYRGVPVVAAVRAVPDSPWFLVARMDASEVYAPLQGRFWETVLFVALLLIGIAMVVSLILWRQRSHHYRERYEAAAAIASKDRRYRKMVESGWDLTVVTNAAGEPEYVSDSLARVLGYTLEEYLAAAREEMVHPDDLAAVVDAARSQGPGADGSARMVDMRARHKDGHWVWLEVAIANRLNDPDIRGIVTNARDITERKRAEAILKRQRDLYGMLSQTNQAIARCTNRDDLFAAVCRTAVEHGRFFFAWIGLVDTAAHMLRPVASYGNDTGYVAGLHIATDPSNAMGQGPSARAPQLGRHWVSNDFLNDPATAPWHEAARRGGVRASAAFPFSESGRMIGTLNLYAGDTGFFDDEVLATLKEIATDISFALDNFAREAARKRAEQARRESEERLGRIVDSAMDGIVTVDENERVLVFNAAAEQMFGCPSADVVSLPVERFIPERFRAAHHEHFQHFARTGETARSASHALRIRGLRTDGEEFPIEASISRTEVNGRKLFTIILRDVTERVRGEEARAELEIQLRLSQKMEALGTLAGGIAHDFNNMLGAIIGNVELAAQDVGADHPARESLDEIRKASRRARDLVQSILAFGRQRLEAESVITLWPVLEETVKLLRMAIPAGIEIDTALARDTPPVLADATQIQQVLMNLCTNAWQAMDGDSGRIDIRLDEVTLDADAAARVDAGLRPGRYARLTVADTGRGMDAETIERAFDPFFTTKPIGTGTGLGLSIVHGIVKAYRGTIQVASDPGKGTTFTLLLPAAETSENEIPTDRVAIPPRPAGAGQHVLYLDDEDSLVFLVTRLLERFGYRVSGYTRADAALAAVRADPSQFDLVVTDLNMPAMSGLDVARELTRLRPELPVVLTSGYITEDLRTKATKMGVRHLIYKPNTVEELCAVVQRLVRETI